MKLIIAGGRDLNVTNTFLVATVTELFPRVITEIVSGGATGIDSCAKEMTDNKFATDYFSQKIKGKFTEFPANWEKHGKAAGPIRNREMAEYGDALLLIWDGESRGSKNMKETMLKLGKPVWEVILKRHNT